jgi:hypothetical protein
MKTKLNDVPEVTARTKKPQASKGKRGWLKLAGWAKDDPIYTEAMKLGSAWRKAS